MAQQIDEAGGALLARMIGDLGISLHVGTGTESIESVEQPDGSTSVRVRLTDGQVVDAGLVIFAAGIRPRDELAGRRRAGARRTRRGAHRPILPDKRSRHLRDRRGRRDRRPVLRPGRTRLRHRRGGRRPAAGRHRRVPRRRHCPRSSSCWASTWPASVTRSGVTENCLEVAVNDAVNRTYAKLVLSDDAKTLLGGVLVGDASSYGVLRPMVGSELPGDPLALIAPARVRRRRRLWALAALPDAAQICSCNNVTKGRPGTPRSPHGCADVPRAQVVHDGRHRLRVVRAAAQAAAGRRGASRSPRRCASTSSQSRAELFEIVCGHRDPRRSPVVGALRPRQGLRHLQTGGRLDPGARPAPGTSSTASRPRCRTPTTTSWPTSRRTAATRWCRGSPAARSRPSS